MNETMQNILTRRSIRQYKPDPVPRELIDQVVLAGTYAPTARGMQSPIILAITDKEIRDRLARANAEFTDKEGEDPFHGAPVVLVVLADKSKPNHVYDGSLVMANLMLAAHALGLGSCWINRARETFELEEGKRILADLGIQGDYEGIGYCALGYVAKEPGPAAPRKADYVRYVP